MQSANAEERWWIPQLKLFLGIQSGERLGQTINWLRWWNLDGDLLLWSSEQAEQERLRATRLAARLEKLGIDPNTV